MKVIYCRSEYIFMEANWIKVCFMINAKVRIIALSAVTTLVLGQSFIYAQSSSPLKSVAFADVVTENTQTPASIIADAKKELERRKQKNKVVLEDGHQDFYSRYLIGVNAAIESLDQLDTDTATVDDANQKVKEAYTQEEVAFNEIFADATETSIAALDVHIRGMKDASTNEKVKAVDNTKKAFRGRKQREENKQIPRTKRTAATNTHPRKPTFTQDIK